MILVDLHLRDKMDTPPFYLELLSLVRRLEEEHFGRSRKAKAAKANRAVHFNVQEVRETSPPPEDSWVSRKAQ